MSDSIKVAIKVRPLIKRELDENLPVQWTVQGNSITPVDPELRKRGEGGFHFDHIFDTSRTNTDLFNVVAKPIIDAVLTGVNGTIFAYGQTGSGKTYSMMGSRHNPGVIPLAVDYIFDTMTNSHGREFLLRISYIEIYNERVNDLLDKNRTDLKLKEGDKAKEVYVPCKEEICNTPDKVLSIMKKGDGNRRTGETNMNERSSRSHTIFRITLESQATSDESEGGVVHISQLNLVDLAGSERASQTGATGERFNEGRHINLSLSSLGLVIMQLSECQDNTQKFINFRDSKLTRILQTSLGGNAMTTIVCAITPAALEETQCTLAFASRAKRVKNKPQVNEELSDKALIRRYAKQMAKLKAELEKVKSADVVEMESKLMEKERANQILEERIELMKKSIVCGNSRSSEEENFSAKGKRRRTWCGSGTSNSKIASFHKVIGLPTIKELDKSPEKSKKQENMKRRQSIFQTLDIANESFQTEFADFEIELIASEIDNNRYSDASSACDDDFFICKRPQRSVQFQDDVSVISCAGSEPASPGTPKTVLRNRAAFLMEEYNVLRKDHRNLEEFAKLEKQMFVDDAVEKAMAEHKKLLAASEQKCREMSEKYTKLEETVASLTAENEELSTNLRAYRELSINLSDRNKLLEAENIELSSSLMEKIQECDSVTDELESLKLKIASPAVKETAKLIEVPENSCIEFTDKNDDKSTNRTVDDLLRLSIGADNSLHRSKSHKIGLDLLRPENTNGVGESALPTFTVDDLLQISLVANGTPCEVDENDKRNDENVNAWKTKAQILQERVNHLDLLNNKLSDLKIPSCTQCAHLTELNETRKSLKLESKTLDKKLQELQEKFVRECADSALLRTKANEDPNLSVCDLTFNSSFVPEGNLNISFVEEKVQSLYLELEALREKHDKLSDLYKEKCDEIDKIQEACSRETTSTPVSTDSPRNKRSDEKLEIIQTDVEELRTDLRSFKKNLAGVSAALRKFVNEKAIMQREIESLRAEKAALTENRDSTRADERIALLENEVARLNEEIFNSNMAAQELGNEKSFLEAEVETLKEEKTAFERKIAAEESASGQERIEALENEVTRLCEEIQSFDALKRQFVDEEATMQREIESLRAEKAALTENRDSTRAEERIALLENEVAKLNEEIFNSNTAAQKLVNEKNTLVAEVESLREERAAFERKTAAEESAFGQERIEALENEVTRLCEEIQSSNTLKQQLEEDKVFLEAEVHSLQAEKGEEIRISNAVKEELEKLKYCLEAEVDAMKAENSSEKKFASAKDSTTEKIEFLESEVARLRISNLLDREVENTESFPKNEEEILQVSEELEDTWMARETMKYLENEVPRLSEEMNNTNVVKEVLVSAKSSPEAEVESPKAEEVTYDEKITQTDGTLAQEIVHSNNVRKESESAKSSPEAQVQYLKSPKASTEAERASSEERISELKTELIRLRAEVDGSNDLNKKLEDTKSFLEAEIDALKADKKIREKSIAELSQSLRNFESTNFDLKMTLEKVTSEKDELVKKIVESQIGTNNNGEYSSVVVEELRSKLSKTSEDSKNYILVNEELNNRLTTLIASEDEINAAKLRLEDEIATLQSERRNYEASLATLQKSLDKLQETNASITAEKETMISKVENAAASLEEKEKENTELRDKLRALEESEKELKDTIKESEKSEEELMERLREFEKSLEDLMKKLRESEKTEEELMEKLRESGKSEEELTKAKHELTRLKSEIIALQESNSSLKSKLEETKTEKAKESQSEIEASYETLKECERTVEELQTKVQDITNDLRTNTKETAALNEQLTKLNNAKDELNDDRLALESKVTSLKVQRDDLEATLKSLRQTVSELEDRNSSLDVELQILKAEKQKVCEIVRESVENPDLENYEKNVIAMNDRVKKITAELEKFAAENDELNSKVAELQETVGAKIDEKNDEKLAKSTCPTSEKHANELESARQRITTEIKSLKPTAANHDFAEKSVSELFALFVDTIMSKEREIIKAITDRSECEKRKLEEQNRQCRDAEKRTTIWAKELEAEVERTQQDLIRQEAKTTELNNEIAKLQNLLKESAHENQLLVEKIKVLELDFNTLQAELEKHPEAKQNVTLNSTQERERLIQEAVQTREMELSAKLRLLDKQSREKLEELTKNLESYRTKNLELTNNLDGLEANERQLKSIVDMKTNELIRANNTVERLRADLEILTESHDNLTQRHSETSRQVDEITALLKTKCDKLSEYKTKLETITPEYEHLKDQAAERLLRLEKYKSEIECITTENEKAISSLKDLLDSTKIKSAGYCKQLSELTNRNTVLQTEVTELRTKCEELERANAKLTKSMRNSTSRIRAEEEMEDLRDRNRTLQRNLDGASNRISDLQEMKTRMLKELVDLRGQLDAVNNENREIKTTLGSHRATVDESLELRAKYESLLLEKNRIALEFEAKKSSFLQLETKHKDCAKEIEELKKTNKDLNEEMDDMVSKIHELTNENAALDDKLYAIESGGSSNEEVRRLKAQIEKLESEIEGLKSQREHLRKELLAANESLESFKSENSELRVKVGHLDRRDSLSSDSSRSGSPALESARVDNRRRRSRTELFNQKRQLGIFEPNKPPCCGECRCSDLQDQVCKLERELVTKNGEIATMEIRIQSENFPHMKRCKDLEELHAALRRKCKHLEEELQKVRKLKATELSSECDKCRHWKANKRDQSTQCLPGREQIYLSGTTSGIVEEHIKMTKLQKTNDRLKDLCRGRQRQIEELHKKIKVLEDRNNINPSSEDEKSHATGASSLSSKADVVNSRQAMKENVPMWENQRPVNYTRREWFHK